MPTRSGLLAAACLAAAAASPSAAAPDAAGARVHVLSTICGKQYVPKTFPMLRSMAWHSTTPLTVHIIADRPGKPEPGEEILPTVHTSSHAATYTDALASTARQELKTFFSSGW